MGGKKSRAVRPTHRHALLGNGIAALVFGLVCLVLPFWLDRTPALPSLALMLRIPAAIGLGIGAILLVLHVSARRHAGPATLPLAGARQFVRAAAAPGAGEWTLESLQHMDALGFEAMCEMLFAQAGFSTRAHPALGGDAVDVWLYSRHAQGPAAIVRCRHEPVGRIEVEDLCRFYAAMVSYRIRRGTYVTNTRFGADAAQFGKTNGMNLLDGERLLGVIATRTPRQREELLAAAYERA